MSSTTPEVLLTARVRRLSLISAFALGLVWWLALNDDITTRLGGWSLMAGWVLMPAVLSLSLARPGLRPLVAIPSTLVTTEVALLTLEAVQTGSDSVPGWFALLAGLTCGGLLGAWLWFDLFPVPRHLRDPESSGRYRLIGIHVSLTVSGLVYLLGARYG